MNNLFTNLNTDGMEQQKDVLGGYSPLETGAYLAKIKTAYVTMSKNNAMAVNLVCDIDGREYREQLWITNSQGQNFYKNKSTGNKVPLPGFTMLNDICMCAVEKELRELDTEPRVFKIYDFDTKSEMPKEVPTITELLDSEIILGITKQVVDKTVKDASGNYVPSGETREENVIEKVFHAQTHKTVNEARANVEEASFYDKWVAKNAGHTKMKAKGAKAEGKAGMPTKPATKSLFS